MTADVVTLASRRPHTTGPARCAQCGHEWIAVVEVGIWFFECPECHTIKGHRIGVCTSSFDDGTVWECRCGTTVFQLIGRTPDEKRWTCVNCGTEPGKEAYG